MAARRVKFPPLPKTIHAPGGRVRVVLRKAAAFKSELPDAWGTWEAHTRTIKIDANAPVPHQWWTLFHELTHVALDDAGVSQTLSEEQQQMLCDAMATARMRERFG